MAEQGYDVWMDNIRGNTYSRRHVSLSPSNETFWNFSFHEMSMYNIPAMISYITSKTSQPLHMYVGYSMGTTMFYVMASNLPHVAEKVKVMVSLAPVAFMKYIYTRNSVAQQLFVNYAADYDNVKEVFGEHGEFLPQKITIVQLIKFICGTEILKDQFCDILLFLITGFNKKQIDNDLLPVILNQVNSGASIRTFTHYIQEMKSGRFCWYDYGKDKNLVIYNATKPPDYNLQNITVPIALFYAGNDWVTSKDDIKMLKGNLSNVIDTYEVPHLSFNHQDFVSAQNAPKLVYERVLEIMKNVTDNMTKSLL